MMWIRYVSCLFLWALVLPASATTFGATSAAVTDCVECGFGADNGQKPKELTLRYSGAAGVVTVYRSDKVEAGNRLFQGYLSPGATFTIRAADIGERDLGSKVGIYVGGTKVAELHTSCSAPLGPGTTEQTQGDKGKDPNGIVDVTVLSGIDKQGRGLCPINPPPPPPPPPPGNACHVATNDCLTVELIEVTLNSDGTSTYDIRVVYNCNKGLSFAAFELPTSVSAVSYSTGGLISGVENPGGTGGPFNPGYRNLKFAFGGDIKNGESIALSFTLPAGVSYTDGIRVRTKGGRNTQDVTLDPALCNACPDGGPPVIHFEWVYDLDPNDPTIGHGVYVTVTDDTQIGDVSFIYDTSNIELIASNVGTTESVYTFRVLSLIVNSFIQVSATDACGTATCPGDANPPTLTLDAPSGRVMNGMFADDTGIVDIDFFFLVNATATSTFDPGLSPQATVDFQIQQVDPHFEAQFGILAADYCNAFIFDPVIPAEGKWLAGPRPGVIAASSGPPAEFVLRANRPNPFRESTEIAFDLPETSPVRLAVFDVLGREVTVLADGLLDAGTHRFTLDAHDLPAGTYVYRLLTPQRSLTGTMMRTR